MPAYSRPGTGGGSVALTSDGLPQVFSQNIDLTQNTWTEVSFTLEADTKYMFQIATGVGVNAGSLERQSFLVDSGDILSLPVSTAGTSPVFSNRIRYPVPPASISNSESLFLGRTSSNRLLMTTASTASAHDAMPLKIYKFAGARGRDVDPATVNTLRNQIATNSNAITENADNITTEQAARIDAVEAEETARQTAITDEQQARAAAITAAINALQTLVFTEGNNIEITETVSGTVRTVNIASTATSGGGGSNPDPTPTPSASDITVEYGKIVNDSVAESSTFDLAGTASATLENGRNKWQLNLPALAAPSPSDNPTRREQWALRLSQTNYARLSDIQLHDTTNPADQSGALNSPSVSGSNQVLTFAIANAETPATTFNLTAIVS